jgi:hypothetical protein
VRVPCEAFGPSADGYLRISLTEPDPRLTEVGVASCVTLQPAPLKQARQALDEAIQFLSGTTSLCRTP